MLATASLTLAAGGGAHAATLLGSLAAAIQASRLGNDAVSAEDLLLKVSQLTASDAWPAPVRMSA